MASLRDVLNHVGKPFELHRDGVVIAQGLATVRPPLALVEPKAEPKIGDVLVFGGQRYTVVAVAAEKFQERLDHYRLEVRPS